MISKFFIDRPVLAWVIAILALLFGSITLPNMEISRFPNIAPPSVRISLSYPGATPQTLENSVAQVIEQQMTGLDGLLYFSTRSTSEGNVTISFSFDPSINPDVAQMQVQNRLDSIMTKLPEAVQKNGARVRKVSDDTLLRIAFYAEDGSMPQEDIADFLASVVQDPISRINGVGQVSLYGSEFAVRIWLDPRRLFFYKINPSEVVSAIQSQNKQISVGQLGGLPSVDGQRINVQVKSRELLTNIDDFKNILIKVDSNGGAVYLKDVANVEMGRASYTYFGNYNGKPQASLNVDLSEGANAIDVAEKVEKELQRLKNVFPNKLTYAYAYDTVPFVKASLYEVCKTLIEALLLVSLVLLLFLRNLRSTFIVILTVPIVLSATIVILNLFNISINTLSMFAMVLAIGLLVDDAIVVVENVNRLMETEKLTAYEASVKSMKEISSALFGVGIVIAAVFTPMGFFSGATGNIYKQFSVTIVSSMLLSVLVAIIITPSFCASLLKNSDKKVNKKANKIAFIKKYFSFIFNFLNIFDVVFNKIRFYYDLCVDFFLHRKLLSFLSFILFSLLSLVLFFKIPSSFLPIEDQGTLSARIILPAGYTQELTKKVALEIEEYFLVNEKEYVDGVMLTLGSGGGSAQGQSTAQMSIRLKNWEDRDLNKGSAQAILARAKKHFDSYSNAKINFYLPASVRGLGSSSGFSVNVQNVMGHSHEKFVQDIIDIVDKANENPYLYNVRYETMDDSAQLLIKLNDLKAGQFNLDLDSVNQNLEIAWGGKYVNDFLDRGRIKKVYVQAMADFRSMPDNLSYLYFKNKDGNMVSFDAFGSYEWNYGPMQLERFNGVSSISIIGDGADGVASGEAMQKIANIIEEHNGNYSYAWSGISYQELISGSQVQWLFLISAIVVFLCLAALYESWSIPVAVLLMIPIGVLGSLLFVFINGIPNDVYLQIGILTTGALSCKNAILIVEYSSFFHEKEGLSLLNAARKAAKLRFRPIVMTSVAFLLGVLPLYFAQGAGAVSQQSIGTGVIGGTIAASTFGIILIPSFFVLVVVIFSSKLRYRYFKLWH